MMGLAFRTAYGKWLILILTAITLSLLLAVCTGLPPLPDDAPLRDLARRQNLTIGTSVDENVFKTDPEYRDIMAREFSMLTPENALKFERVQPEPSRYDFSQADSLLDFAEANGMSVHGHTLLWHRQLPQWLTQGEYSSEQLQAILRTYIHTVVGHYHQRIPLWDVVSEAVDDNGQLRDTFWLRGIGPDYIALAFQWAHEADPQARLLYNDYANEGINKKSNAIYQLARDLRQQQVPIHGVGLQMHLSSEYVPGTDEIARNMQRLDKLGLEVHITEMDVRLKVPANAEALAHQARIYRSMLGACLTADNCRSFAMWGFTDRYSWIPEFFPGWGAALPLNAQFQPKPAYHALVERLRCPPLAGWLRQC